MWKNAAEKAQSLFVLVLLAVLLGVASPHFSSGDNLLNVLQQSSINALLGVGLTFVIISGGIDLSVGSIMALCGLVVADLLVAGHGMHVAITVGLSLGALCGTITGLVTTLARIPPFIATLGMMLVARSAAKIYSGSKPISGLPDGFRSLSGDLFGIPVLAIIVVVLYIIAHLVLTRTKLGRYAYAIGGNEQAAWLSGVPTGLYKILIYALSGLLAAVAAVMMTSRLNAASPLAGEMYELYAIAAAVIGGVSLMGGEGRVIGTLIGALIMGTLRNGLNLLNVPSAWEGVVVGTVLVAAVVIDRARHRGTAGPSLEGWRRYRKPAMVAATFAVLAVAAIGLRITRTAATDVAKLTIAFVPKSLGDPFWLHMRGAAEKEGAKHGAQVITLAPERETDVEAQYQVIENLIEQQVDAILLAPVGAKEIVPAIKKANDAGIPVLILDSDIDHEMAKQIGAKTATYIGSDNFLGGNIAGHYLAQLLGGDGKIAVIEGTPGHESTDQRQKGFLAALDEYRGMQVITSQTANSERERGYTVAQNMLQAHPEIQAFFAANDVMALGALEAVSAAGKLDQIRVLGFDASADALENIKNGRLLGSVAQYPTEMGRLGVLHAVRLVIEGKPPPPVIHTKVEMIDRQNVGTFATEADSDARYRLALITHSKNNTYWDELAGAAREVAAKNGAKLSWRAPERPRDVEAQFELVSQVVNEGFDGLILAPAASKTMTLAVRLANEAGIPVLIVDSKLDEATMRRVGARVAGQIGSDNVAGGAAVADYLAAHQGGGEVAILVGAPENASTHDRAVGFRAALKKHGGFDIVASATAYAERGVAKIVSSALLRAHPKLVAIFATNGLMALGVLDALAQNGGHGPMVLAFDATAEILEAIESGKIAATVQQAPKEMGRRAVEGLLQLIAARSPAGSVDTSPEPTSMVTATRLVTGSDGESRK